MIDPCPLLRQGSRRSRTIDCQERLKVKLAYMHLRSSDSTSAIPLLPVAEGQASTINKAWLKVEIGPQDQKEELRAACKFY